MRMVRVVRAHGVRKAARKAARAGDWQGAAQAYRGLVAQGVATSRDMVQLAHSLKEAGDAAAAADAYRRAAAAFPHDIDAQLHHGLFLQQIRRNVEATNVLARTLAMDPGNSFVRAKLAELGIDDDAMDAAMLTGIMAGYDAARPATGSVAGLILGWRRRRARRHARAGQWSAAAQQYRRMLSFDPHDPRVLVQLGHALREQGHVAQAVSTYRDALIANPRHAETYLHLGHALKALGRRPAALQAYLVAAQLQPDLPPAVAELQGMGWDADRISTLGRRLRDVPETGDGGGPAPPRLVMPDGLTRRQQSIWLLLAAKVENGN